VGVDSEPEVVGYVDLERYLGTWYEIASFPQSFSKGCFASQAKYSPGKNGKIRVVNTCRKNSFEGKESRVSGNAKVVDKKTNAKLKVTFFWPFSGDYWIVALDSEYQWAAVSGPKKDTLWILSRTRQMDPRLFESIVTELASRGYEVGQLELTPQPE
jgi:apolipoprotein D and lipocalin family protein